MPDVCAGAGKKPLGGFEAFKGRGVLRLRPGVVVPGQPFDLLHIKNRVTLQEANLSLRLVSVFGLNSLL